MPIYTNKSDNYTMVHFGSGDLVVLTNGDHHHAPDEVIITPTYKTGEIGDATDQYAGKTTDNIPVGIRLCFERKESAQVVIDALQKIVNLWPSTTQAPKVHVSLSEWELVPVLGEKGG
jgi:hypothetical protein